ncbi:MAG: hypothetical protein ACRC54_04230 [Fusobacteriaceae bacterium]
MYLIKIIGIYMIVLIASYAAPSGFGASAIVPVSAFIPYQEPSIRYIGGPVVSSGIARQPLNEKGEILLSIMTFKPTGNGNDGTVFVKYPRKVMMGSNEANGAGKPYSVLFNLELIDGGVDIGTPTDWKSEITIPYKKEVSKSVKYLITGEAPVAGKYEGRINFEVLYN